MDQNVATIISNIVVLVAALAGAAIGALLAYLFSLGQEKRTKKREVIVDV